MRKEPALLVPPPTMICQRRELGALSADHSSSFWRSLEAAEFRENLGGGLPEQPTAVRVAWDETELRVLVEVADDHAWATITQRDGRLWEEEVVELFLDPIGDGASYFEIEMNPLGTVLDLVLRRNRSGWRKDFAWDCEGLRTFVQRREHRWAAELAIPFASVAAEAPRLGETWRVNFCRIDRPAGRERELSAWAPTLLGSFHAPQRFGTLIFAG